MQDEEGIIRITATFMLILALSWIAMSVAMNILTGFYSTTHASMTQMISDLLRHSHSWRIVLTLYSLETLLMLPVAVGLFTVFRRVSSYGMFLSSVFLIISMMAFLQAALLWSSMDWHMASLSLSITAADAHSFSRLFAAINEYYNTYLADFVGYGCAGISIFIMSWLMLSADEFPKFIASLGLLLGTGLIMSVIFKVFDISMVAMHGVEALPLMGLWFLILGGYLFAEARSFGR